MSGTARLRLYFEALVASVAGLLCVLTLIWRDWIEVMFGWDPDHHSGSLEWTVVVGLALASVFFAAMARTDWRRSRRQAQLNAGGGTR